MLFTNTVALDYDWRFLRTQTNQPKWSLVRWKTIETYITSGAGAALLGCNALVFVIAFVFRGWHPGPRSLAMTSYVVVPDHRFRGRAFGDAHEFAARNVAN